MEENNEDREIEYLENRIEELLGLYAKKYDETMKGDFLNEQEPLNFSPPKILGSFEEEKAKLDGLIKEFVTLNKNTEKIFEGDDDQSKKYREEKLKFENEFVRINCEIQNIRSENETLIDEIKIREDHQQHLDQEISEKNSLVKLLESKIYDIKLAHNK